MSVTCKFDGRLGNILFAMSNVIAHCKRYNLQWYFPINAWACIDGVVPIQVHNTDIAPIHPIVYTEPLDNEGHPYYHDIPVRDNVLFQGYYQSFRYFDEYRQGILDTINLPWNCDMGITALHIRRGDCVSQTVAFPLAPIEYYHAAIDYMLERGHFHFRIYSDDIPWTKEEFTEGNYPGCIFEFMEGGTDVQDFIGISRCENVITARSTFSLMASWFNQYEGKIVLCPAIDQPIWWLKQNRNLLDSPFITQIHW